jgi:MFS family permease
MVIGFPGVIFAIMVYFLREPERSAAVVGDKNYKPSDWKKLLSNPAFVMLCLGYALLGLATNNLSIWGATFYSRVYKFDLLTIGFWGGMLTLFAGIPATLFGGAIADWFKKKGHGRMFYGALLSFISVPFWFLLIFNENIPLILVANFVLLAAALAWLGAAAADATEIAGVNLRGLAIAIYFFSVNIAAYLIGSNLIGYLNDRLGATENPAMMRYSLLVCPVSCLLSVVCLFIGNRAAKQS